ncbi:MAG: oxaloacetate-decarboxylating malate dehydrogenase, partial [Acidimicrobiia bacterium]
LLQWEDFANSTSFRHLRTHRKRITSFNDDIQGTAAMVVAGLITALRFLGQGHKDQRIVIAGAGSAGYGISRLIIRAMVADGADPDTAEAQVFVLDSRGLLVADQSLRGLKAEMATPGEVVASWDTVDDPPSLTDVIRNVHPTILIGVTGQAGLFSKEAISEMAAHVERPIILPLSNPTSLTEVVPSAALAWTEGRALVATGSPFAPVEIDGRIHRIGQANNAYIFPGVGLGIIAVRAREVTEEMFLAAAIALAEATPRELMEQGQIFPNIDQLRPVARAVAIEVAKRAIIDGVADPVDDVEAAVDAERWEPEYTRMRPA